MNIRMKIKRMIENDSPSLNILLQVYNRIPFNNKLKNLWGGVDIKCALLKNTKIISSGKDNKISISRGCRLKNCSIYIYGNHNRIIIGEFAAMNGVDICIEDDNNEVVIGEHSSFEGNVHLACIEGTKVHIGKDCMFSANISIRTGDSHSITDLSGQRINPSKDVIIGNHVWIGNTVLITKSVHIKDNSIIGTGSVVTRKFDEENCIIVGNPATIVKKEISWDRKRFKIKEKDE